VPVGALTLALATFALPIVAEAQQGGKVYLIGELREGPALPSKPFADAMREFGWVEGQNFRIERRHADTRTQLPALAAELVRRKVDLILTGGTAATAAAKEAKTIPIVLVPNHASIRPHLTTYWYAPAARAIVKSVTHNPYLGMSTVELVEFQLQP
jgi:putative ABC transport system substrate-binding protein